MSIKKAGLPETKVMGLFYFEILFINIISKFLIPIKRAKQKR